MRVPEEWNVDERRTNRNTLSVHTRVLWLTVLTLVAICLIGTTWLWGNSILEILGGVLLILCGSGWAFLMLEREAQGRRHM